MSDGDVGGNEMLALLRDWNDRVRWQHPGTPVSAAEEEFSDKVSDLLDRLDMPPWWRDFEKLRNDVLCVVVNDDKHAWNFVARFERLSETLHELAKG